MSNYELYFDSFGEPISQIKIKESRVKGLNKGEILVEMVLSPINPSDLIPISGAYAHRTPLPSHIGYEGVGIVRQVYDDKNTHLIGKRILPLRGEGTWQKFVITMAEYAIIVPDEVDDYTASQCYINPVTAWLLCSEIFHLKKNEILLVNASNSSIGKTFVQLSKVLGFHVISIIRSEEHRSGLEKLGAFDIINSSEYNVYTEVMNITKGSGVKAGVDLVGGIDGTDIAKCVQKEGMFRSIGILSGKQVDWPYIHTELPISSGIFHLRHWIDNSSIEEWQEAFTTIFDFIKADRLIIPAPEHICPITLYKEAIYLASHPKRKGKILFYFL